MTFGGSWQRDTGHPWDDSFPPNMEDSNDDDPNNRDDESSTPSRDEGGFFSADTPGYSYVPPATLNKWAMRAKFNEFLRVAFNGARPSSLQSGSRCSGYLLWHAQHTLQYYLQSQEYRRIGPDDIGEGDITIPDNP